ncbi:hypothetical protein ACX0G7_21200 [Flavitalea antarctica]
MMDLLLFTFFGGSLATTVMTLCVFIILRIFRQMWNLIAILGAMLTGHITQSGHYTITRGSLLTGIITHYTVGFLFAAIAGCIWNFDLCKPVISGAIYLGSGMGIIGAVVWRIYFAVSRYQVQVNKVIWMISIFIVHIIFTLVLLGLYHQYQL